MSDFQKSAKDVALDSIEDQIKKQLWNWEGSSRGDAFLIALRIVESQRDVACKGDQ